MRRSKSALFAMGLFLLSGAQWASADVIYDSYPKNTDTSYDVRSVGLTLPQAVAEQFTPSANYSFSSAKLALFLVSGTNDFTVSLDDASGPGGTPGTALETFTNVAATPDQTTDLVLDSVAHPELLSGDTYYLVAIAVGSDTDGGWTYDLRVNCH
ncbi:MAG: choice-of-anchor R domain-containing protein [Tepidisphaeraceae bacterium]